MIENTYIVWAGCKDEKKNWEPCIILGKKKKNENSKNYKKWQNFGKTWNIEADLSILIALIIFKKY